MFEVVFGGFTRFSPPLILKDLQYEVESWMSWDLLVASDIVVLPPCFVAFVVVVSYDNCLGFSRIIYCPGCIYS